MMRYLRLSTLLLILMIAVSARGTLTDEKLNIGDTAPNFTLPYATQDTINITGVELSDAVRENNVILAFYPADWSGGCTKEMCTMRDNVASLAELGATVFGISGDYVFSHHEWAKFHKLPFALLSDHNHDVARKYGSYNAQSGFNMRTVFVVNRRGNIAFIDLQYKAGSPESFEKLKTALQQLK